MSDKTDKADSVTMRVRIGDSELEVSGSKQFVKKEIDEFLEKQRQLLVGQTRPSIPPTAHPAQGVPVADKAMSIAQFFKQTSPKSDVDRTLFAGYFL
jgi:hypothetical protein